MKHLLLIATLLATLFAAPRAEAQAPSKLEREIASGPFKAGHIQGIAVDAKQEYIYYSYTTMLIKTDSKGNIVGTVTGLLGHLGDLDYNAADGRVYGSLEYKNDAIGRGILNMEKSDRKLDNAFYIAIFDVERINRVGMDAEKDGIMTTVYLPTVLDDYLAQVELGSEKKAHRLGCSGIDGVAFGPKFGSTAGKEYLTVAYGIYNEQDRSDNDYQVLLQYDVTSWAKYEKPLSQDAMHQQGPKKPTGQYFAFTGNTNYGVQNLEYDAYTRSWLLAVYKGSKKQYPNYSLFAVDATVKPTKQALQGVPYIKKGAVVPLKQTGMKDEATGIRGWMFPVGSTGMVSLGDGYFYFSHNYNSEQGQGSTIRMYRYSGRPDAAFDVVK